MSDSPSSSIRGSELASDFTVSLDIDKRMYREDIAGSIAHAEMLGKQGIVSSEDVEAIIEGLRRIREEIEAGEFEWKPELEDIHINVEARLYELIGDTAGRLHTARSRNDQVATDARLYVKRVAGECRALCRELQRALLDRAEENVTTIVPGYTHLQRAQPVSFGHVLMAYYEMFGRDAEAFGSARATADMLPLGSGALAGATYPLDQEFVAERLGFSTVSANSMDAVSDRDFVLDFIFAAAKTMTHLSRLCEDIVVWSSEEFGFVRLSDAYSSGSSMMPQKRNPDYAELIRGKSGRVFGSLMSVMTTLKGLPLTYNRDLQEDKPPLMDAYDTVAASLAAAVGMVREISVNRDRMEAASQGDEILATDYADYLVRERGMPFREAYVRVAAIVHGESASDSDYPTITALDSINARDIPGGTAPWRVREAIMRAYGELGSARLSGEW
ncbi:MAG: argininosuccinate lyase [Chloroflexi bacterium]|nr:argininosuccinate lyase [Chloroflexota bacterium]MYF80057.1 argininosuccinate lyase [Chloroflexota bacterium]MYK61793.1 argininosuccinate lyase [Chloroflexota bacterium]